MIKISVDEIKKQSLQLFLEKGYNNVTVNDICTAIGITKPTFYKYIGAKEDLILDLYDSTIQNLLADTYNFIKADTHYEQLLFVFKHLIEDTTKYGSDLFSQMLISNLTENHHSMDMRPQLTKLCTVIIEKAQQKGEILNQSDASLLYNSIAFSFTGYEFMWCVNKGILDWEKEFFESIRSILWVRDDLKEVHLKYIK